MTNNSIFTRVLALMLCLIMLVGTLTACLNQVEPENHVGTTNGGVVTTEPTTKPTTTTTTTPTTGDVVEDDPVEDPVEPVDPNEIFSASTNILSDALIYGSLASDVVIGGAEMGALVPADVKVEAGASSLALSVKKVDEVLLSDALSTLDVHINGVALDNTVPMIVKLGAILEAGLGATELKLYHTENGVDNLMTRVNSPADFAIHNQYYYNAETGEVTIYVASFSVFYALKSEADVWDGESTDTSWYVGHENDTEYTLTTVEQFVGFRDLVDAGNTFAGKTVTLGTDIDLNKKLFNPIGYGYTIDTYTKGNDANTAFMGTFDGDNHIIYNLYQQGWDLEAATGEDYTYSTAGAGLFASIENATIKNLVVSGADIKMECVDMGIVVGYAQGVCHFENIIVTNSKIANYQRATGGVVGEVCFGPYGVEHNNENFSHTFKNIVVDSSVTVGSLWGDFDNLNGGVIGGKWGDATVKMEDVTVAVTLDAYSDVTSAYQWYAYRRSGMLIGHTEQNSPKKAETADAPFLKCENVKVYYGDWVNYTYCQFEHTNNPGYRYPWVRVQAGLNCGAYSNPRYGNPTDSVGNKVTTDTHTHAEGEGCHVLIKFDQLYGGGQGVYGKADHEGVTVVDKNTTTIYIKTNATNLKLFYWYDTTWTNVVDGIDLVGQDGTFRADIPAYAYGFKFVVDGVESNEFVLAEYEDGSNITLGSAPCTHENTTTTTVDATCTTDGSTTVTCDDCKEVLSVETISATGHTAGETVVENTTASSCTEKGSYDNVVYCSVCEVEISRETITVDALGHTPVVDAAVAPTCTATGLTEGSHCSVCSAVIVAQETVAAKGHTVVTDKAVAATCTATGLTEGSHCSVCNAVIVAQETVAAKGHTVVTDKAVAATCTTAGKTEGSHCSVCNTVIKAQTTVAALGHNWNINTHKCSVCSVSAPTKTIYFKNEWQWSDVRIYYWYTTSSGTVNNTMPGTKMIKVDNDGTYDYYTYEVPEYLTGMIILDASQMDKNGYVPDNKKTPDISPKDDIEDNEMFYMLYVEDANNKYQVKSEDFATYKAKFNVIYLSPNSNWKQSNAWFMAYVWDGSGNAWYRMSNQGSYYVCWIPKQYTNIIFCRMNSAASGYEKPGDWNNVWNQTSDLTITIANDGKNLYTVKDGTWSKGGGTWSKYTP